MANPPGQRVLAFASRWFGADSASRVFEPLVADWQREWQDAAVHRRAWVRVRGGCGFAIAALTLTPSALLVTPMPASMTRRVIMATYRTGALTVALGAFGWTLAGIGRTRAIDGAAWWTVSLLLILLADGRIVYWIDNVGVRLARAPAWTPLAVFGTAALLIALVGGSQRHATSGHEITSPDHEMRSPDHKITRSDQ